MQKTIFKIEVHSFLLFFTPMDSATKKHLEELLVKLMKNNNAFPFNEPVDPIQLGIPDYFEKIKEPMDLSTIKKKLEANEYPDQVSMTNDIELMLRNCYTYNPKDTPVHNMGLELEKSYINLFKLKRKNEPTKKVEKKRKASSMSDIDYEKCKEILAEFQKPKYQNIVWPFLEKITDEIVPGYSEVIKHSTDLQTITEKVEGREFDKIEDLHDELKTMVHNCFKFNAEVKRIYDCGVEMEKVIDALFKKPTDKRKRLEELRNSIKSMESEIEVLEGRKKVRPYNLEERLEIGNKIMTLNQIQTTRIAQIISKAGVQIDFINKNIVEVDLRILSDETMNEIEEFVREATTEKKSLKIGNEVQATEL